MKALKIPTIQKQKTPTILVGGFKGESNVDFRRNAPEILDVTDAARFLDVCSTTLLELVHKGAVPCKQIGRRIIFGRRALVDWVNKG